MLKLRKQTIFRKESNRKKEKRKYLSFLSLALGFYLLILQAIEESQERVYKDNVIIEKYDWGKGEYYNYINGRVRNKGDKVLKYFKVKVYYLDEYENVFKYWN